MAEQPREEAAAAVPAPPAGTNRADSTSAPERYLRTRADFDDYKRRVERDRAAAAGRDGMRHRLRSVLDAEGAKVGRGYVWNGTFFRPARVRAAE